MEMIEPIESKSNPDSFEIYFSDLTLATSARLPVEFQTRSTQVKELQDPQAKPRTAVFSTGNPIASDVTFDLHRISLEELSARLKTSLSFGLTNEVAEQRLLSEGPNSMSPPKSNLWRQILHYLFGGFCMILWPAAILCILAWRPLGNASPPAQIVNLALGVILLISIFVQAAFTAYQDWQSSRVMERIAQLVPSLVRVFRADGHITPGQSREISAEHLVVGDIIEINAGDKIGADVRLIEVNQLTVDQSILTGESLPVSLSVTCTSENPYESRNLAYLGTCCVEGSGRAVVIRTGDQTVMGQLAKTAAKVKTKRM
jgi:sodium/potassium-transporting ATPase subunit alpha